MRFIAVTGGIATGKSSFCQAVASIEPGTVVFDADESVSRQYADATVQAGIRAAFGEEAITADGGPNRRLLRQSVFGDESARRRLEEILHPRVRRDCLASRDLAAKSNQSPLFLADIPLLFESGLDIGHELVVVVATAPATQARRLRNRDGFDDSLVRSILAAQLPIAEKIRRADVVVWNDGPAELLRQQAARLLQCLIPG